MDALAHLLRNWFQKVKKEISPMLNSLQVSNYECYNWLLGNRDGFF